MESHLNVLCELLLILKNSSWASVSLCLHSIYFASVIHARFRFIALEWELPPPCLYNFNGPCPMCILLNKCLLIFCSQCLQTLSNSLDLYPQSCFVTKSSTCVTFLTLLRSLDAFIAIYLCSKVKLPMVTLCWIFASGNSFLVRGDSASSNTLCENAGKEH